MQLLVSGHDDNDRGKEKEGLKRAGKRLTNVVLQTYTWMTYAVAPKRRTALRPVMSERGSGAEDTGFGSCLRGERTGEDEKVR